VAQAEASQIQPSERQLGARYAMKTYGCNKNKPWENCAVKPQAPANAIGHAKHRSRSHDAVIRVYDDSGNAIETHKHKGEFREW